MLGRILVESLDTNRLPAVVLLTGPAHLGKATAARWLVQYDLCLAKPGGKRPCGICVSCRQLEAQQHPQVVDLRASQATMSIDDLRQGLRRWLVAPLAGEHRWLVLTDAETLTEPAANSLLKFLEEVPAATHILMTSSQPSRVPSTLRSRASIYRWHVVSPAILETWVATTWPQLSPSQRTNVVARSAGRPGLAKQAVEHGDDMTGTALLGAYLHPEIELNRLAPDDLAAAIELTTLAIREIILYLVDSGRRLWPGETETISTIARQRPLDQWLELWQRSLAASHRLRHHLQPRLLYNDLLL